MKKSRLDTDAHVYHHNQKLRHIYLQCPSNEHGSWWSCITSCCQIVSTNQAIPDYFRGWRCWKFNCTHLTVSSNICTYDKQTCDLIYWTSCNSNPCIFICCGCYIRDQDSWNINIWAKTIKHKKQQGQPCSKSISPNKDSSIWVFFFKWS